MCHQKSYRNIYETYIYFHKIDPFFFLNFHENLSNIHKLFSRKKFNLERALSFQDLNLICNSYYLFVLNFINIHPNIHNPFSLKKKQCFL